LPSKRGDLIKETSTKDRSNRRQTAGASASHHAHHALAAGVRGARARRPATPEKGRKGAIYRENALFRSLSGCGEHQRPLRSPPNRGSARPLSPSLRTTGGGARRACTCARHAGKGPKRAEKRRSIEETPFFGRFRGATSTKDPSDGRQTAGASAPRRPQHALPAGARGARVRTLVGPDKGRKGPFSRDIAEWPSLATAGAPGRPPDAAPICNVGWECRGRVLAGGAVPWDKIHN
jgi:hypothetical protein